MASAAGNDGRRVKPGKPNLAGRIIASATLSFRGRAILFLVPMIAIISAVYTVESISTERQILRSEIVKRGETIAIIAAKNSELALLSENIEQLKISALPLMEIQDVAFVSFFDRQAGILLHQGMPHPLDEPLDEQHLPVRLHEHEDVFVFLAPVMTEKAPEELYLFEKAEDAPTVREQVGWVRIGLLKEVMSRSERQIILRGSVLAVVFSIVGFALLYIFITLATRPLYALINAVQGIREGEHLEVPVPAPGSEIGRLTAEFNRMSRAIKEREDELKRHRDQLEVLVARRTQELTAAKEQAELASRAKSDFLSRMSHELRTPLNAILGYAQILKRHDNISEAQRQQLDIMHSSGEHLLTLINDILDVGKIEASRMELLESAFDLPALIEQVFNLTTLQAEEKSLGFKYVAETPLPAYVLGDERKVRQILLNLLSNAVKYTRRGRVTMRVSYVHENERFHCEVVDTGIGIPRDKLEAIFEPFAQLSTDRQAREGTGLGLNITRRLLELMRGRIAVESALGSGSTFRIEVPLPALMDQERASEKAERRIAGYRGERRKILVVDDTVGNAAMLVSLLEPLGFQLSTARNGREALAEALARRPDLVILDLVMPEVDGTEAAVLFKRHPELSGMKILGASATVTGSSRKAEFLRLCDDFVAKPIAIDLLLERIGTLLGLAWEYKPLPAMAEAQRRRPRSEGQDYVSPPPSEMEELYRLAMRGDMLKIETWAQDLGARRSECENFAARLQELARGFKANAILALVEQYRGEKK